MKRRNPFSAIFYIRENLYKNILCMFMMFLASLMFLAGNYIQSTTDSYAADFAISDKLVVASLQASDKEYREWEAFRSKMLSDPNVKCVDSSALGFTGFAHGTVMNLAMEGTRYVFNSKEDMESVFACLGIEGDLSRCKNKSIVLDEKLAKNLGLKQGDVLDESFNRYLNTEYTVDAIVKGGEYNVYYLYEDNDNLGRLYIFSDTMEGRELYEYVQNVAKDYEVHVEKSLRDSISPQFDMFNILFMMVDVLIAVVLAVTINSVVTGQYLKRTYEFGIYRAIGIRKGEIWKKVASEIICINVIANAVGFAVILLVSYLLNELIYKEQGIDLLYATKTGMVGFLICDILILVPLIFSKGRKMCKADVTEF